MKILFMKKYEDQKMPHKCINCGKVYDESKIVNNCECGNKLFVLINDSGEEKIAKELQKNITEEDRKKIENDIYEIIGNEHHENTPIILDIEAINIKEPGKYELDLDKISSGDAFIYRYDEGKYIIDIEEAFRIENKKDNRHKKTLLRISQKETYKNVTE
jgi:predicted  nucleic acid-binding Zn-ribbon protein